MGNPISDAIKTGTLGELLVQIRLLQHEVQAAPPIKDSGNDLIAVKKEVFRGVQVKTTESGRFRKPQNLPEHYHILAFVDLRGDGDQVFLDDSNIYLVPRQDIDDGVINYNELDNYLINSEWVNKALW